MRFALLGVVTLALTGCGDASLQKASQDTISTMSVEQRGSARPPGWATAPEPLKVALPQIAYTYSYVFRLSETAIAKVQADHIALCDRLGPTRCQVLAMTSNASENGAPDGSVKLRVASGIARSFGTQLAASVSGAGGRQLASSIKADDVSKDIVDTEARLRQRELLVARLTEILRTRQGKVAELVEAERSVAAAQEEIDQARGWLSELRGRVAMSVVDIEYRAVAPGPAAAQGGVRDALNGSASVFVAGLSALLQLAIYLLPWSLLVGLLVFGVRRLLPRFRRSGGDVTDSATDDTADVHAD